MTASERIQAIHAIVEFMNCNPHLAETVRAECVHKVMDLIKGL